MPRSILAHGADCGRSARGPQVAEPRPASTASPCRLRLSTETRSVRWGHIYHDLIGTGYQQDVDLDKLFIDVAVYNQRIMGPAHVEALTNLACRHALARRGVAHLTFPVDLQALTVDEHKPSKMNVPGHTSATTVAAIQVPPPAELRRAFGELVSCSTCVGTWAAAGLVYGLRIAPPDAHDPRHPRRDRCRRHRREVGWRAQRDQRGHQERRRDVSVGHCRRADA